MPGWRTRSKRPRNPTRAQPPTALSLDGISDRRKHVSKVLLQHLHDRARDGNTPCRDTILNGNRNQSFTTTGSPATIWTVDEQDRLTNVGGAGGTNFTYSANGELRTASGPTGSPTFHYDALGRLRTVVPAAGTTKAVDDYHKRQQDGLKELNESHQ